MTVGDSERTAATLPHCCRGLFTAGIRRRRRLMPASEIARAASQESLRWTMKDLLLLWF